MTPKERAEAHWDGYVGPMQRMMLEQMVEVCMTAARFHYVTSHIHGVKHSEQDAKEDVRALTFADLMRRCGASNNGCNTSPAQEPCHA